MELKKIIEKLLCLRKPIQQIDFEESRLNKKNLQMSLKDVHELKCPFFKYCKICDNSFLKICCLRRHLKEKSFIDCSTLTCYNHNFCILAISGKIKKASIPELSSLKNIKFKTSNPVERLDQKYIPKIDIHSPKNRLEQLNIIKDCNIDTIAISLQNLISKNNGTLVKKKYDYDLHELLDYDGKILGLTNISDLLCGKILINLPNFIKELNNLKIDMITTLDANFYSDQPHFITALQMKRILEANKIMSNLDIPQIGLVPPAAPPFFKLMLTIMYQAAYKILGIPMLEINKYRDLKHRSKILKILNNFKHKSDIKTLLISTSPIRASNSRYFFKADYFTSLSWTIIKNSKDYSRNKIQALRKKKLLQYIKLSEEIVKQQSLESFG